MRRTILAMVTALALAAVFTVPAAARAPQKGTWHRLNPDQTNATPQHEEIRCQRISAPSGWHCHYGVRSESTLGFQDPPEAPWGSFVGTDITQTWVCPEWFDPAICDSDRAAVVAGVFTYLAPDQSIFSVDEELIVIDADGGQALYVSWVDQFVCPWYRSFDEALEANPFPLPFDGKNWPVMDCTFAP